VFKPEFVDQYDMIWILDIRALWMVNWIPFPRSKWEDGMYDSDENQQLDTLEFSNGAYYIVVELQVGFLLSI